ncbi:general stress protein [Brachybacterium sp. AOP25-B2-12]|uniref:general stress protein n=1 Tax=Brachybacterium sp. AOP25-B2-12 TaxID=3457710 RepID=UPI004033E643
MTNPQTNPLSSQLFTLKFPRSLGTYSTYAEVQAVVDTLADHQFAVQNTMIVGTDLKLMERVTGRRTWGRVIGSGILSGMWMGLFVGILFSLVGGQNALATVVLCVLMGAVFFTVWSVIGYAMSGGRRDFTSTTATIPMQFELLVEHTHADDARRILVEAGAVPPTSRPAVAVSPAPAREGRPSFGRPAETASAPPRPDDAARAHRPQYGAPAPGATVPPSPSAPGDVGEPRPVDPPREDHEPRA